MERKRTGRPRTLSAFGVERPLDQIGCFEHIALSRLMKLRLLGIHIFTFFAVLEDCDEHGLNALFHGICSGQLTSENECIVTLIKTTEI